MSADPSPEDPSTSDPDLPIPEVATSVARSTTNPTSPITDAVLTQSLGGPTRTPLQDTVHKVLVLLVARGVNQTSTYPAPASSSAITRSHRRLTGAASAVAASAVVGGSYLNWWSLPFI